jgi:hypothetical protein
LLHDPGSVPREDLLDLRGLAGASRCGRLALLAQFGEAFGEVDGVLANRLLRLNPVADDGLEPLPDSPFASGEFSRFGDPPAREVELRILDSGLSGGRGSRGHRRLVGCRVRQPAQFGFSLTNGASNIRDRTGRTLDPRG